MEVWVRRKRAARILNHNTGRIGPTPHTLSRWFPLHQLTEKAYTEHKHHTDRATVMTDGSRVFHLQQRRLQLRWYPGCFQCPLEQQGISSRDHLKDRSTHTLTAYGEME